MTDKTAEEIAKDLASEWKHFWMNQRQNSEDDFKNYFQRAFGVDANMLGHLSSKICLALVEAEKRGEDRVLKRFPSEKDISRQFDCELTEFKKTTCYNNIRAQDAAYFFKMGIFWLTAKLKGEVK